ncbi:hypothetical protein MTR67_040262 [Solanum verrucosum]|uniref:Reverse transcriptase/retrotransposon-derived protein RNase H-like domain-containing protein n=1 Tax=Solanum verrucosum TaxID=315347 RepID=A0AAF0ZPA0_SOLVR|nr:hypothetical protein MTR67_040262 [Solanum verrucosum]
MPSSRSVSFILIPWHFLGYVVSKEGIQVDPAKIEKVRGWTRPTSVTEIWSFVGLVGYYRQFLQRFSPLTRLTYQSVSFHFQKLKTLLMLGPVLNLPDKGMNFTMCCGASGVGLGSVLMQKEKKDYDITILYHLEKANVVADALSRKTYSMESFVVICVEERPFSRDIHRLSNSLIRLQISEETGGLIDFIDARSSLAEQIRECQFDDEKLCLI